MIFSYICVKCGYQGLTESNRRKYCDECCRQRPWDLWSLDYKKRLSRLCSMAKNRANTKQVPFDIDTQYLIRLWEEQQGCCALTGQEFDLTNWGSYGQVNPRTPSVDRIIPKLGYTKGNIRLITYHMNIALSDFGVEEFENLVRNYRSVN